MPDRCHWIREEDGVTILIPGCWPRVYDPDATCLCGEWSEDEARSVIRSLKRKVMHLARDTERLRRALHMAGIDDPTTPTDWQAESARQARRRMHLAINGGQKS